MSALLSVLSAVFWGLLVLSLLVFVHEGGHYLAARALRVRATEFFLGMPCRAKVSRTSRKVGTEFGVTPVLLGGYTKICGMEGPGDDPLLARALACVQAHGRVGADDLARELGCDEGRAYGLLATLADWASVEPYYDAGRGERPTQRDWPHAFQATARDGSGLTRYDRGHDFGAPGFTAAGEPRPVEGDPEAFLAAERSRTYLGAGFVRRLAMLVAGPAVNLALALAIVTCALMVRGVDYAVNVSTLGAVEAGGYADAAGLREGDVVTSVEGEDVGTWEEFVSAISPYLGSGTDFSISYERDGVPATAQVDLPDGQPVDVIGVYPSVATYHPGLLQAARAALGYAGEVGSYVVQLIQPAHTMEVLGQSSSVVGISVMSAQAAQGGAYDLALLVAAVSMSLGFMNLLPIPPLDGGKVLIEVVQLVLRRPLPARAQRAVSYVGLAFFAFVFVFVLRNDLLRFVIG